MIDYCGKNILIIGLGLSGVSAAHFLLDLGATVIGFEQDQKKNIEGVVVFHEMDQIHVPSIDLVIVSPGISRNHPLYKQAVDCGKEVIGEVELGFRHIKKNRIVGITGTNGKTTVTLLIDHVLKQSGKPSLVVGNVGTPLTSILAQLKDEILVCELSSYQLETVQTKVLDAGVILNITPDHLDRYHDMNSYAQAKMGMIHGLKEEGRLYLSNVTFQEFGYLLPEHIFSKEKIAFFLPEDYRGRMSHEVENKMAALALCKEVGITAQEFAKGLDTFKKPAHRLEFVKEIDGIKYYNDSKATNIDAVIKAVDSIDGEIILIAGGVSKGSSFQLWVNALTEKVKLICAIGQAEGELIQELQGKFTVEPCRTLERAMNHIKDIAKPGDHVLFSPGCASFDQFANYEARGNAFKSIVEGIKGDL